MENLFGFYDVILQREKGENLHSLQENYNIKN